jgi:hypothetical protein
MLPVALMVVFYATGSFPVWTQTLTINDEALRRSRIVKSCGPSFFAASGARAAMINCEMAACLDDLALRLSQDTDLVLVIDGHRDKEERAGISLNRAYHLRRYLIEDAGVDANRITVRNFSDSCPHEAQDQDLNRRVEYWLLPFWMPVNEIAQFKKCDAGSLPSVIETEKPLRWRHDWKSESLY